MGSCDIDWLIDFIYIRGKPEEAAIAYLAGHLNICEYTYCRHLEELQNREYLYFNSVNKNSLTA